MPRERSKSRPGFLYGLLISVQYAMLAGYLPFDDDPANPEGDNINLLYKYIVTTPLTFPEYVTPHARDLLRRILVPDPRKRADLFEVARHSWLSEYAHVVSHITSSTTNVADIANSTVPAGMLPPVVNSTHLSPHNQGELQAVFETR
jgi:protein-serine/threonine kinase